MSRHYSTMMSSFRVQIIQIHCWVGCQFSIQVISRTNLCWISRINFKAHLRCFCEKNMFYLPIYHRMRVIGVVICWFHHHITPCLIVPSVLVNSIIIMDYLAMYFHPLGDLYLRKLCSHFYSRFERLSKKIHMNINSQLYCSFHMGCIFFSSTSICPFRTKNVFITLSLWDQKLFLGTMNMIYGFLFL